MKINKQVRKRVGFYSQTCPQAEEIVKSVVQNASISNPRIAPILLRLQHHDCFVEAHKIVVFPYNCCISS